MNATSRPSTDDTHRSAKVAPSARLRAWYAARVPRERRLLALAAAVVLGGGLIALTEQLVAERERLARSLPAARLAYLAMEQDSLGLATLRERVPPTPPALATLPESIRTAARARAIEAEARIAGERVEVSGRAALPTLVDWIASLHTELRLRPSRLELQPAATDGRARFEAVFEPGGQ